MRNNFISSLLLIILIIFTSCNKSTIEKDFYNVEVLFNSNNFTKLTAIVEQISASIHNDFENRIMDQDTKLKHKILETLYPYTLGYEDKYNKLIKSELSLLIQFKIIYFRQSGKYSEEVVFYEVTDGRRKVIDSVLIENAENSFLSLVKRIIASDDISNVLNN
jgi:hypothetical protein